MCVQSCPTLRDPMDCTLPGSSVCGIFQARILEWLPFPPPGDLPDPGIEPGSPALWEVSLPTKLPGKPWGRMDTYICRENYIIQLSLWVVEKNQQGTICDSVLYIAVIFESFYF